MPRLGGKGQFGRLNGAQIQVFRKALLDAFNTEQLLDEMLLFQLTINRQDISLKPTLPARESWMSSRMPRPTAQLQNCLTRRAARRPTTRH